MSNTVLQYKSTFFIDVSNVLLYTDLFIYHELTYRLNKNADPILCEVFKEKTPTCNIEDKSDRDTAILLYLVNKKNQNVLMDWIDKPSYYKTIKELGSNTPIEKYVALLYYDFLTKPTCNEYIQLTRFGHTIKLIIDDINTNHVDLYMPFHSDFINNSIYEAFLGNGNGKLKILEGKLTTEFFDKNQYDVYAFENVENVDLYLNTSKKAIMKDVIIPTYEHNMMEDRTRVEIVLEQITYKRLKLRDNAIKYRENNLNINTIDIPI